MINETIKKNGLTFGVLSGIVSALITSTIYAIDLKFFVSLWVGVVSIMIYLILAIVLLSKTKKELKGIFTFKEAFTTYFISAVIAILIGTAFNILLFNVIDPSAQDTLKEIAKMKESNPFSTIELLKGSASSIVFSSIFGLIMAAFFKSKSQE